jgi:hypothetical protein
MLDIVTEIVGWLIGGLIDWTARGLVLSISAASAVCGVVACWLILTVVDPLTTPGWGFSVFVGCYFFGVSGLLLSLLYLIRDARNEAVAYLCVMSNAVVVLMPTIWLWMR